MADKSTTKKPGVVKIEDLKALKVARDMLHKRDPQHPPVEPMAEFKLREAFERVFWPMRQYMDCIGAKSNIENMCFTLSALIHQAEEQMEKISSALSRNIGTIVIIAPSKRFNMYSFRASAYVKDAYLLHDPATKINIGVRDSGGGFQLKYGRVVLEAEEKNTGQR